MDASQFGEDRRGGVAKMSDEKMKRKLADIGSVAVGSVIMDMLFADAAKIKHVVLGVCYHDDAEDGKRRYRISCDVKNEDGTTDKLYLGVSDKGLPRFVADEPGSTIGENHSADDAFKGLDGLKKIIEEHSTATNRVIEAQTTNKTVH